MSSEVTNTTNTGQTCYSCGGRGSKPVGVPGFLEEELCATCDGSGVIQEEAEKIPAVFCPKCGGTGGTVVECDCENGLVPAPPEVSK